MADGDLVIVLDDWVSPPTSDPYGNRYPALDAAETIRRALMSGFITGDEARYRLGMIPCLV